MNQTKQSETQEKWRALIEEQQKSGQTQSEFCKLNNLMLSTFTYYRGKFKPKGKIVIPRQSFSPIKLNQPSTKTQDEIRIKLPNGFECQFLGDISVCRIKQFVEAILSC